MNIIIEEKYITFGSLFTGNIFLYEHKYYIKLDTLFARFNETENLKAYNAFNLEDCLFESFSEEYKIEKIKGSFIGKLV